MYASDGSLITISLSVFYLLLAARLIVEYNVVLFDLILKVFKKAMRK